MPIFDDATEEATYDIDDIKKETDKAFLVSIDGDDYWFPKSQCRIEGDTIIMPTWLAMDKGL